MRGVFFAVFAVENEFLEISELLRKNSIAIPDGVLNKIERFVNQDLNNLVYNPDEIFSQLPHESNTIESIRARNVYSDHIEHTARRFSA